MNGIERCSICNYHEGVEALASTLGTQGICFECFEAKAEMPIVIWQNENEVSKDILRRCTCWHGPEIGYLNLQESYRRFTSQMPAVITEDDVMAKAMAIKINEVSEQIEKERAARKKPKGWFRSIVDWFRDLGYAFDEAVSAGL